MPEIGEIKYGYEIGKGKFRKYIYQRCQDCGDGIWIPYVNKKPKYLICFRCMCITRGKTDLAERTSILVTTNKGTLDNPEVGDMCFKSVSHGSNRRNKKYIWVICPVCEQGHWTACINNKAVTSYCRLCCNSGSRCQIGKRGADNPGWKGGKTHSTDGYICVRVYPEDFFYPMAKSSANYILEHRLVMAKHLGRCLHEWECVHHKNGIRYDNRLENLELSSNGNHQLMHSKGYKDGYLKGLQDGKDAKIIKLEARIKELESLSDSSTTLTDAFAKQYEQSKFAMERPLQTYKVS
jgi:hypothetical protein